MAWSQPRTWSSDKITDAVLNAEIRDNMDALKDPPSDNYTDTYTGSSFSSTTSTSFVAIHANYSLSLSTRGGDILVCFSGVLSAAANWYVDLALDGQRIGGTDGILAGNSRKPIALYWLLTGKPSATYTFDMYWKVASGTLTLENNQVPQFWAREVS